jgi:hypothetical protein
MGYVDVVGMGSVGGRLLRQGGKSEMFEFYTRAPGRNGYMQVAPFAAVYGCRSSRQTMPATPLFFFSCLDERASQPCRVLSTRVKSVRPGGCCLGMPAWWSAGLGLPPFWIPCCLTLWARVVSTPRPCPYREGGRIPGDPNTQPFPQRIRAYHGRVIRHRPGSFPWLSFSAMTDLPRHHDDLLCARV